MAKESAKENKKEEKKYKEYKEHIVSRLQDLKESGIPFYVIVEGGNTDIRNYLIKELSCDIDPRFFSVFVEESIQEEERHSFLYPFFCALPENGKIRFMHGAYMDNTVKDIMRGDLKKYEYLRRIQSVNNFERSVRDNGYVIVKFYIEIDKGDHPDKFGDWKDAYESFVKETGKIAKWNILKGSRSEMREDIFRIFSEQLDAALEAGRYEGKPFDANYDLVKMPRLADVDLSVKLTKEEYKQKLDALQDRLYELNEKVYQAKIPVVIALEGWDAAGKGGAIRRLAYPLDPRSFEVLPIASPDQYEKARHFLWRFYTRLPKTGHIHIFDRTWYGRVMVERIEGFCSENDWERAYNEINEFEEDLTDWGAVVLKYWIQIDSATQLERFNDRQNTPEKQWKITDEDWRNREKWDQYETAIQEMLDKTSTTYAPWHIIESVDKYYARIKVLELTIDALEKALKEKNGKKN